MKDEAGSSITIQIVHDNSNENIKLKKVKGNYEIIG